jgi:hypothetical protein
MLLWQEPLSGQGVIEATFRPEDVPDARLYRRLQVMGEGMLRSVLEEGDERPYDVKRAERRGAARLYANKRISADRLAQCAQARCIEAIQPLSRVLVAHDTVEFDEHGRHEPTDAGPLRSSQARGYLVHHGLVLDPTNDARIGVLYQYAWTRPYPQGKPRPAGKIRVRRVWDNEDDKWSWGVEQAHEALATSGFEGHVRHVVDHEGSSYATLVKCKRRDRDYMARTKVDRAILEGDGLLFAFVQQSAAVAYWTIEVEEKPKSVARGTVRRRRTAHVELRFAPVTLKATCNYTGRSYKKGLPVWAVYVHEPKPPRGSEPLDWMLLSIQPIETKADAEEAVLDYRDRWGVEDINKVFKSGCHTELATVPNLAAFRRLLAVAWPIAAHIARWTYAARVRPLEPAAPHLDPESLEALKQACRYHRLPLPRRPWTLRDVTLRLAQMGGYELRKGRQPGWKVIFRGWRVFNNFWDHQRFLASEGLVPPRRTRPARTALPPRSAPVLPTARSPIDPG